MNGSKIWFAHRKRLTNVRPENSRPCCMAGLIFIGERVAKIVSLCPFPKQRNRKIREGYHPSRLNGCLNWLKETPDSLDGTFVSSIGQVSQKPIEAYIQN